MTFQNHEIQAFYVITRTFEKKIALLKYTWVYGNFGKPNISYFLIHTRT